MPTRSKVVVVIGSAADESAWARRLHSPSLRVRQAATPAEADRPPNPGDAAADAEPDAVLIDAAAVGPDVPRAVRSCRRHWPDPATPVLVVNLPDADAAAAAIDAGATDALADDAAGPLVLAHVRRVLRAGDAMRTRLEGERLRLRHESLTRAAADVAQPLAELVDHIESAMTHAPAETVLFDELLDRVGRAVDALDRLRQPDGPR